MSNAVPISRRTRAQDRPGGALRHAGTRQVRGEHQHLAQPQLWAEASRRLLDFTQERQPEMDRFGLDVQVLSLNSPGIRPEPEAAVAVRAALAVNDLLASVIGGRVRPGHAPHAAKPNSRSARSTSFAHSIGSSSEHGCNDTIAPPAP
jgi:hypothetical protein